MDEGVSAGPAAACAEDKDCDGVKDGIDNCPLVNNPSQRDSDRSVIPAGLVGGWRFEETTGTVAGDVTGVNPGEIMGAEHVAGKFGSGLKFSGSDSVRIEHSPTLDVAGSGLTVAAWVKPEDGFFVGNILKKTDSYDFYYDGFNVAYQQGQNLPAFGFLLNFGVRANEWSHIAATYDGAFIRTYLNGNQMWKVPWTEPLEGAPTPLWLGCGSGGAADTPETCNVYFKGTLDEVGVWNRALSLDEIHTLTRNPLLTQNDGLGDACDLCPTNPDASCAPTTCLDIDGDGVGAQGAPACAGAGANQIDCDDHNAAAFPGAPEACDGVDNNCDGRIDEACLSGAKTTRYVYNAFNQLLASGRPVTCAAGDADCDGVMDAIDNCPSVSNVGQEDSDRITLEQTGPTGVWRFEDGVGTPTVRDSTTRHNDGTRVGGATFAPGRNGNALLLNGSTAYVDLPATVTSNTNAAITIEAWVKSQATSVSFYRAIMTEVYGADANIEFGLFTQGASHQLSGAFYAGGYTQQDSTLALPQNQWVHVAGTYDGSQIRLYQDGVKVAESAATGRALPQGDSGWQIGNGTGQKMEGLIDDVAVYERALTDVEVLQHMRGGDGLGDACDPCMNNPDPSCRPATCVDADGDGFGPQGASNCSAGQPEKFDCDDSNPAVHPGVAEVAGDAVDNNCDGIVDGILGGATTFRYDANGSQVRKADAVAGTTSMTWDARDRLVNVASPNGSASYGYDTNNLRVSMDDAGGNRRVLLDGVEELAEYESVGGSRAARYDHDPSRVDGVLAQVAGAKSQAFTDALGSVYGLTDTTGAAVTRYNYDAYGARSASTENVPTSWGFTGRRGDLTGLQYSRTRYLGTDTGLFLSRDPVGVSQGTHGGNASIYFNHPYTYAAVFGQVGASGPTNVADPMGLFAIPIHEEMTWFLVYDELRHLGVQDAEALLIAYSASRVQLVVDTNIHSQFIDNFRHAMRDGIAGQKNDEGRPAAEAKWTALKAVTLRGAVAGLCGGEIGASVGWMLGQGLHAVQDHIAHPNFPTWDEHGFAGFGMSGTDEAPRDDMLWAAREDSLLFIRTFVAEMRANRR